MYMKGRMYPVAIEGQRRRVLDDTGLQTYLAVGGNQQSLEGVYTVKRCSGV